MKKNPQTPSARRILGMVVGIVIIGLGIALFKQSHLGNDSISALNMRLAEMLGISLGVQNLCCLLYTSLDRALEACKCSRRFAPDEILTRDWAALTDADLAQIAACGKMCIRDRADRDQL